MSIRFREAEYRVIRTRHCVMVPDSDTGYLIAMCLIRVAPERYRWQIWLADPVTHRLRRRIRQFWIKKYARWEYLQRRDETKNIVIDAVIGCLIDEDLLERAVRKYRAIAWSLDELQEKLQEWVDFIDREFDSCVAEVRNPLPLTDAGLEFTSVEPCAASSGCCCLEVLEVYRGRHGRLRLQRSFIFADKAFEDCISQICVE